SSSGTTRPPTSPDLAGLCRQWLALPPGPGGAKDSPRFSVLVQAAGGSGQVTGFCRLKVSASVSRTTPTGPPSTSRTVPTSPARRSPSATVSVSDGN
ncbi:hypothetical protein, partial [uncultured Jatrophihabitans sp.]|uniref:hypothetical protein n=1 Tax=uncultured Jatrophihabitans sp. TaxID=1610747 RepID=UPI0035CC70D6